MPAPVIAERIGWPYSEGPLKKLLARIRPEYVGIDPADRVVYEPGQIAQCDLWFPETPVPVAAGQARILPVLVMTLAFSRFLSATMIPSRQAGDILSGMWLLISQLGRVPKTLVWDRESAIGGTGRVSVAGGGVRRHPGHAGSGWPRRGIRSSRAWSSATTGSSRPRSCPAAPSPHRRTSTPSSATGWPPGQHPHRPRHPGPSGGPAGDRPPGDDAAAAGRPAGRADPPDPAGPRLLRARRRQRLLRRPAGDRPVRRRHRLTDHGSRRSATASSSPATTAAGPATA